MFVVAFSCARVIEPQRRKDAKLLFSASACLPVGRSAMSAGEFL